MPAEGAPGGGAERGRAAGERQTKRSHPQRSGHPAPLRALSTNSRRNIPKEIIKETKRQDTDAVPARPPGPAEPPRRCRRSAAPASLCGATAPRGPPSGRPASPARRPLTLRGRPAASATGGGSPRPAGLGHGEEPRRCAASSRGPRPLPPALRLRGAALCLRGAGGAWLGALGADGP